MSDPFVQEKQSKGKVALLLGIGFLVVAGLVAMRLGSSPEQIIHPNPNGIDALTKAGQSIEHNSTGGLKIIDTFDDPELLKTFLATNQRAMALFDEASEQEISIPIDLNKGMNQRVALLEDMRAAFLL